MTKDSRPEHVNSYTLQATIVMRVEAEASPYARNIAAELEKQGYVVVSITEGH